MRAKDIVAVPNDVLDALSWLHNFNIVYRDVRWDNIVCVYKKGESNPTGILIDLVKA